MGTKFACPWCHRVTEWEHKEPAEHLIKANWLRAGHLLRFLICWAKERPQQGWYDTEVLAVIDGWPGKVAAEVLG